MKPLLSDVERAVQLSWCRETAQVPNSCDKNNPAAGQCWQTAYVVRHFFGGDIIIAEILPLTTPIRRHAWNKLPDGTEIDLSRSQFGDAQKFKLCSVDEEIIWKVVGEQSRALLNKVRLILDDTLHH